MAFLPVQEHNDFPEYITPMEASRLLNLSTSRIRDLADAGEIKVIRTQLGRLFERASVLGYAERRLKNPPRIGRPPRDDSHLHS